MSSTERKAVEVGNVYAIVGDDKLQAVEVEFNDNLKGTDAAVTVLNTLNASLHNAGWVANSVMRVAQRDAQVQRDGDQDGDNMVANDEGTEGKVPVAG